MITQANKLPHLPLLAAGIAAIVVSGIAISALALAPLSLSGSAATAEPMRTVTAPASAVVGSRGNKCADCGVIESTRKLETPDERAGVYARTAAGHRGEIKAKPVQNYEITIRLRDGSRHVITDADPARWRLGERVMVIAGIQQAEK